MQREPWAERESALCHDLAAVYMLSHSVERNPVWRPILPCPIVRVGPAIPRERPDMQIDGTVPIGGQFVAGQHPTMPERDEPIRIRVNDLVPARLDEYRQVAILAEQFDASH